MLRLSNHSKPSVLGNTTLFLHQVIVCDVTTGYFFRDVKDDTVTSQVLSTGLFQNEKDKMMS